MHGPSLTSDPTDESLVCIPAVRLDLDKFRLVALYEMIRLVSVGTMPTPGGALGGSSVSAVWSEVLELAARLLEASRGFVGLSQGAGRPLSVGATFEMDPTRPETVSRRMLHEVVERGHAVLYPHPQRGQKVGADDEYEASMARRLRSGVTSLIAAPIPLEGQSAGVLYLDRLAGSRPGAFTISDLDFANAVARTLGLGEQRRRLVASALRRAELQAQLDFARQVQETLFPSRLVAPGGYSVAGLNRPCIDVSGDTFDVIDMGDGQLVVSIADVAGKGVSAAMLATNVQAAFRTMVRLQRGRRPLDLGVALKAVGEAVSDLERPTAGMGRSHDGRTQAGSDSFGGVRFVTMLAGRLDTQQGMFEYINAGHPAPLMVHRNGDVQALEGARHMVLGIPEPRGYQSAVIEFPADAGLLLYTDGVAEARNPGGAFYGEPRLSKVMAKLAGHSAMRIVNAVRYDVAEFAGAKNELTDDLTLLAVSGPAAVN